MGNSHVYPYSCTNRHHQSSPVPKHAPSLTCILRPRQACTRPCASRNSHSFYKLCKPLVRTNGNKNELVQVATCTSAQALTARTGTHPVHVQACTIVQVRACTSLVLCMYKQLAVPLALARRSNLNVRLPSRCSWSRSTATSMRSAASRSIAANFRRRKG